MSVSTHTINAKMRVSRLVAYMSADALPFTSFLRGPGSRCPDFRSAAGFFCCVLLSMACCVRSSVDISILEGHFNVGLRGFFLGLLLRQYDAACPLSLPGRFPCGCARKDWDCGWGEKDSMLGCCANAAVAQGRGSSQPHGSVGTRVEMPSPSWWEDVVNLVWLGGWVGVGASRGAVSVAGLLSGTYLTHGCCASVHEATFLGNPVQHEYR